MAYDRTNVWKDADLKTITEFKWKKQDELKAFFDTHKRDDGQFKMSQEDVKEVQDRNDELGEVTKHWEGLRFLNDTYQNTVKDIDKVNNTAVNRIPFPTEGQQPNQEIATKSVGQLFVESDDYKSEHRRGHSSRSNYGVELP